MSFLREHILYSLVNGTSPKELEIKFNDVIDLSFIKEYRRMILIEFAEDFLE
ncbi:hypothetical protein [Clostridium butyricum]